MAFDAAGLTSKRNLPFEMMAQSKYHLATKAFNRGIGIKSFTESGVGTYLLRLPRKIFNASIGTISARNCFLAHGASDLLNGKMNQGTWLSRETARTTWYWDSKPRSALFCTNELHVPFSYPVPFPSGKNETVVASRNTR